MVKYFKLAKSVRLTAANSLIIAGYICEHANKARDEDVKDLRDYAQKIQDSVISELNDFTGVPKRVQSLAEEYPQYFNKSNGVLFELLQNEGTVLVASNNSYFLCENPHETKRLSLQNWKVHDKFYGRVINIMHLKRDIQKKEYEVSQTLIEVKGKLLDLMWSGSVKTTAQLKEVWPEISSFVERYEKEASSRGATTTIQKNKSLVEPTEFASLNAKLGFPPEARS